MLQDFFHQPYWHHLGSSVTSGEQRKTEVIRNSLGGIRIWHFVVIFSRISPPKITIQSIQTKCQPSGIIKWDPLWWGFSTVMLKWYANIWVHWFPPEKNIYVVWLGVIFSWPPKTVMHVYLRRKDLYAGVTADVKVRFDGWLVSMVWLMGFAESGR